jgi:broad specificity phosphatase PhoE
VSGVETRWWWVRHAPVVDHGGRIYGQLDMPCDTSDHETLRALAGLLPTGAVWVTSHLSRTRDTAAALVTVGLDAPAPFVEPDLAEQNFGAWQGKSWDEIAAFDPDVHARFWQDPTVNAPPGGESFSELIRRVRAAVVRLCEAHAGRDIVAVTHGGTIRAALALALDLRPAQAMAVKIDNWSLTRLDHIPGGVLRGRGGCWRVYGVNVPPR